MFVVQYMVGQGASASGMQLCAAASAESYRLLDPQRQGRSDHQRRVQGL